MANNLTTMNDVNRCRNCTMPRLDHHEDKCLFQPTTYHQVSAAHLEELYVAHLVLVKDLKELTLYRTHVTRVISLHPNSMRPTESFQIQMTMEDCPVLWSGSMDYSVLAHAD